MRIKGVIKEYHRGSGGYGTIESEAIGNVEFEASECNYGSINIGDEVSFHLYKCSDGEYNALNIEFDNNKVVQEIEQAYRKHECLTCAVSRETHDGFILSYKGVNIYIPGHHLLNQIANTGELVDVNILVFKPREIIIASQKATDRISNIAGFNERYPSQRTLEFQIEAFNDFGLIVSKDNFIGFVPNSHLGIRKRNELSEGQTLTLSVISKSFENGLILSARNRDLADKLEIIRHAYHKNKELTGTVLKTGKLYHTVSYEGVQLKLNRKFVIVDELKVQQQVSFKVIDFSLSGDISISCIETGEFGIVQQKKESNLFYAEVIEAKEEWLILSLNEQYNTCFMPIKEVSDILPWNFDYTVIKKGSKIKASIKKFNYRGVLLSRLLYKSNERKQDIASFIRANQIVEMKIRGKMAKFGVMVTNDSINGLILLENIIPKAVINEIDIVNFVRYCKSIFSKSSSISCVVTAVDKKLKRINCDLNYSNQDNKKRVSDIVSYFNYDPNHRAMVEAFHSDKASLFV